MRCFRCGRWLFAVRGLIDGGWLRSDWKGGEERAIKADFEMAQRRDEAGREVIAKVQGRGLDDLGLWQGEADGVVGVGAAEDDGFGYSEV